MPDPVLLQIADALIAKAQAAGFKSTGFLNDVGKDWGQETEAPAAYLGDAGERNQDGPTRSISPLAGFFFQVIVKGPNKPTRVFMDLYRKLKDGIDNDPKLGALGLQNDVGVIRARVTGYLSDKSIPVVTARAIVADVFVEVEYRHARGTA